MIMIPEVVNEYIRQRFMNNNHAKYKHYCYEWMQNITDSQYRYFIEEMKRLNWKPI